MSTRIDATAPPAEIRLGGKTYRLSPMTDEDIAYLDQWVRNTHIRVARESLDDNCSDKQRELTERIVLEQASRMSFMSGQGAAVISTVDGWSQIMWCGMRHNHPDITTDKIKAMLLDPVTLNEAQEAWDMLNNSQDTRARMPKTAAKKKTAKRKAARVSRRKNR